MQDNQLKKVVIYTDGGCISNPGGNGGYGVVLLHKDQRKELSGGYRNTTNNRMELMAVIKGLHALKEPCDVTIYSDSRYLIDAVEQNWIVSWRNKGWMRTKKEEVKNVDLWKKIWEFIQIHKVKFIWVQGHSGNAENERCDKLATEAMNKSGLEYDIREPEIEQIGIDF